MKSLNVYTFILLFLFSFSQDLTAQVNRNIVVEHFTNTRCGICSSRNPGFYQNLNNQEGIIHLSIHPSSPYPNCVLNQHNSSENDARTNYYNVYGSTPKLTIQGTNISAGTNYGSPTIWDPFLNQTSPVSINIEQQKQNDLIKAKVTLQTEEAHNLEGLKLFIALAEDTVFYNAPNGENLHFDVFRKALPDVNGFEVELPQNIGETIAFNVEMVPDEDWDLERMFVIAILQRDAEKEVIQSKSTSPDQNAIISNTRNDIPLLNNVQVAPNPVHDELSIVLTDQALSRVRIFDVLGSTVLEQTFINAVQLDVSYLKPGAFFLEINNENGRFLTKVIRN